MGLAWQVVRVSAERQRRQGHAKAGLVAVTPLAERRPSHGLIRGLRGYARRRRIPIPLLARLPPPRCSCGSYAGRRQEFAAALATASLWVLALTALMQTVRYLPEARRGTCSLEAAGGTVRRRLLYRASSMQVLGQRDQRAARGCRSDSRTAAFVADGEPQVPTLVAAEFPILAVEAILAALASFTLVGPLGLPWWLPIVGAVVVVTVSAGLRHLAVRKGAPTLAGPSCAGQPGRGQPSGRVRTGRGVCSDRPQLAAAPRRWRRRVGLRRDRPS